MGKSVLLGATMEGIGLDYSHKDMTNFTYEQKRQVLLKDTAPYLISHQFALTAVNFAEVAYRFTDKRSEEVCEDIRKEFGKRENNIFILDGMKNHAKVSNNDQLLKEVCEVIETTYLKLASEPRLSPQKNINGLREEVAKLYFNELNAVLPQLQGTLLYYHPKTGKTYQIGESLENVDKGDWVEVIQLDDKAF